MEDYVIIFNKLLLDYGYSQAQVVRWSKLSQPTISRFCAGENVSAKFFFVLIRSMPSEFQVNFWSKFLSFALTDHERSSMSWEVLISEASLEDVQEILSALAKRWPALLESLNLKKSENREVVKVG